MKRPTKIVLVSAAIVAVLLAVCAFPRQLGMLASHVVHLGTSAETPNAANTTKPGTDSGSGQVGYDCGNGTTAVRGDDCSETVKDAPQPKSEPAGTAVSESSEPLIPIDLVTLSKNPFKYKGRAGVLDTSKLPILTPDGTLVGYTTLAPYGSLKLDKMLDEHTAIYNIINASLRPDGQIAVKLPNSDTPDSGRLWKISVEGQFEGTNAYGGPVTVTAVRFDGYDLQREEAARQALKQQQAESQAALQAAQKEQQEQQKRYEAIMQPEEQRHAEAMKQEDARHRSVMDALNAAARRVDVTKMSGREPEQVAIRDSNARILEDQRHTSAVQQEEQRYSSAQAKAHEQAIRPPEQ